MRLSIFNYGLDPNATVPRAAKAEDDKLVSLAEEVIEKHNFGKGAVVVSEAFHTGLPNFNKRIYMEKGMKEAVSTFYTPHITPFLMHHEMGGGSFLSDGNPTLISVGSNLFAAYYRKKTETATGLASGYGKVATFVPETSKVGEQSAIDALQSRRLLTVSIGAKVNDSDYRCSICGLSRYDSECAHTLGEEYDSEICYAEVYNPLFREYSVVYNPSDINAIIRRVDVMEGEDKNDQRQEIDQNPAMGYINIYDSVGKRFYPSASTSTKEGGDMMCYTKPTASEIDKLLVQYQETIKAKDAIIADKDLVISALARALSDKLSAEVSIPDEDIIPESDDTDETDPGDEEETTDDGEPEGDETPEEEPADEEPAGESDDPPEGETDSDGSDTDETGNRADGSPDNGQPGESSSAGVATDTAEESDQAGQTQEAAPQSETPDEGDGSTDTKAPSVKSVREMLLSGRFSRQLPPTSRPKGLPRRPITVAKAAE